MYGAPYIFHFVHPLVKTAEMMVQRVNFERNLKNICPATVEGIWTIIGYFMLPRNFKSTLYEKWSFSTSLARLIFPLGVCVCIWILRKIQKDSFYSEEISYSSSDSNDMRQ